jgi:SAM-dependent methyltransferase
MRRELQPELLDSLPPNHPDALHNRRDLRLTNRLMGNLRWWTRTLPSTLRPGEKVLEVGAGTGELGAGIASAGVAVDGLDLWPRPAGWPTARAWHRTDLQTYDGYASYDAVIGNLIFHQFSAGELADLGQKLRRSARVIMACEPTRRRLSQVIFAGVAPLLQANHVSLHDARVSIAAGFCGRELPQMLGLAPAEWSLRCTTTALGAYRMIAVRRP